MKIIVSEHKIVRSNRFPGDVEITIRADVDDHEQVDTAYTKLLDALATFESELET